MGRQCEQKEFDMADQPRRGHNKQGPFSKGRQGVNAQNKPVVTHRPWSCSSCGENFAAGEVPSSECPNTETGAHSS